jgi:hypothetical protein
MPPARASPSAASGRSLPETMCSRTLVRLLMPQSTSRDR